MLLHRHCGFESVANCAARPVVFAVLFGQNVDICDLSGGSDRREAHRSIGRGADDFDELPGTLNLKSFAHFSLHH